MLLIIVSGVSISCLLLNYTNVRTSYTTKPKSNNQQYGVLFLFVDGSAKRCCRAPRWNTPLDTPRVAGPPVDHSLALDVWC